MAKPREDKELIRRAKDRINIWNSYWKPNIEHYKEFTNFAMGRQMDEQEENLLTSRHKTPLIMNKLSSLLNNILGEQRQNTPNLQTIAITDNVTDEDVNVRQQIVKSIAYTSESKIAFQNAFQNALVGGYGVIRVSNDYESETSFKQCIKIESIPDPNKCFFDPNAKTASKADGAWAGMRITMSKEKFKKKYPKLSVPQDETLDSGIHWSNDDNLTIVDYLERIEKPVTLLQLEGGTAIYEDEYKKKLEAGDLLPPVTNQRESFKVVIMRYKIAGDYVLEETEFPAKSFAYIFVDQNSFIDPDTGKQVTQSFFKHAKHPQKLLNYVVTQIAYLIKTQRSDQWLATPESVEGHEIIWNDPELKKGYIPFNPHILENGQTIIPQRISPDVISPELFNQYDRTMMDIYTCTGVFETQQGQQGNEISGAAIDARTRRGKTNTYVVFDSLNRGIAQVGNVILQMLPRLYPDEVTIFVENEEQKRVPMVLNQKDGYGPIKNDMSKGEYVIAIEPSGTLEEQKQAAMQILERLVGINPQIFFYIADKIGENLTLPNNRDLVKRFQLLLAPEVKQLEGMPMPEPKPDPQAMLMQGQMQIEQGKLANQQAQNQLKEKQIELEAQKIQQSAAQNYTQAQIAEMRANAELTNAFLRHYDAQNERAMKAAERALKHDPILKPTHEILGEAYE